MLGLLSFGLELSGYVRSRVVSQEDGPRSKRVYVITDEGMDAVRTWAREAPVDPPCSSTG